MFALSLAGFALLGWLSVHAWFYTGPGRAAQHGGAQRCAGAAARSCWRCRCSASSSRRCRCCISRKHEFEADAYAVAQTSGADLSAALLKLYQDNASTLTPDPVFVKFYYSHPPASERLARMAAA